MANATTSASTTPPDVERKARIGQAADYTTPFSTEPAGTTPSPDEVAAGLVRERQLFRHPRMQRLARRLA